MGDEVIIAHYLAGITPVRRNNYRNFLKDLWNCVIFIESYLYLWDNDANTAGETSNGYIDA
jgi:hypothetical protein